MSDEELDQRKPRHHHTGVAGVVLSWWGRTRREYEELGTEPSERDERPLNGYALLMTGYLLNTLAGIAVLMKRGRGSSLPGAGELVLMAVAVFRITRTMSKDAVLSPVRAPFTVFKGPAGPGEVLESPRHGQVRHAVGELITCPFCLGQWVATAMVLTHASSPRAARWVSSTMTVVAVADALQYAYAALERTEE